MTNPSTLSASPTSEVFDPQAPCIGSDGLEYEDFAQRILGIPRVCFRNEQIRRYREEGNPKQTEIDIARFKRLYAQFRKDLHYREQAPAFDTTRRNAFDFSPEGVAFYEWCAEHGVAA